MVVYWLLFTFFAAGTLFRRPQHPGVRATYPFLAIGLLIVALLIGFRYKVGPDWIAYQNMFDFAGRADLDSVLTRKDPGYQFLNWAAGRIGAGIWLVNLVCGLILSWGLSRFARTRTDPWLAVLVAIPYLVIVVAMGYSRQGVALGILLAGLASFRTSGSILKFAIYVAAAALFHKTAVVALVFVIVAAQRSKLLNALAGAIAFYFLYDLFLNDSVDMLVDRYFDTEYSSQGTAIRVAMNLVPAAIFLLYQRRFGFSQQEANIWRNFSYASFGFLILLLVLPSSTVVDRLALYAIPLQIAVLSRVPTVFTKRAFGTVLVVAYSFAVQFTWLNFADHAHAWAPYRLYPFG